MIESWHWNDPLDGLRAILERSGVLVIPTESSYGLAVHPADPAGVDAIYRLKERERGKPLPVVVADAAQAAALGVDVASPGFRAAQRHWPAPLTVVAPLLRPLAAAAGGDTLAVRIPAHVRLRDLLAALGHGLTATSANRSGESPLIDPTAVAALFAESEEGREVDAMLIDDGRLAGGPPSTVVGWCASEFRVLRSGRFYVTASDGADSAPK